MLDPVLTGRLRLRRWRLEDVPSLAVALRESERELAPWLPWARPPLEVAALRARVERFAADFAAGRAWFYAVCDRATGALAGGAALEHRRPRALELGYWLRTSATGRGLATEAAAALTRVALEHGHASAVQIRCDPNNTRSAALAARLGYAHRTTLPGPVMLWRVSAEEYGPQHAGWIELQEA